VSFVTFAAAIAAAFASAMWHRAGQRRRGCGCSPNRSIDASAKAILATGCDPSRRRDPLARLQVRGVRPDPPHELLRRRCVAQIDPCELEAASMKCVCPSRILASPNPPWRVQDSSLRADIARDLGRITDARIFPSPIATAPVDLFLSRGRPNEAVRDDDVRLWGAGRNEREQDQGRRFMRPKG